MVLLRTPTGKGHRTHCGMLAIVRVGSSLLLAGFADVRFAPNSHRECGRAGSAGSGHEETSSAGRHNDRPRYSGMPALRIPSKKWSITLSV